MKGKKRTRGGGWSAADHAVREGMTLHHKSDHQRQRTAHLSHDTLEKRSSIKLRLHLTKLQRQIQQLRKRLEHWDAVEEAEKKKQQLAAAAEAAARNNNNSNKKKGRLGPETWKLRGAARPSWQVNEFDVRYVCPHRKAHEQATIKAQRTQNLLAMYKGQWAQICNSTGTTGSSSNNNNNDDDDTTTTTTTTPVPECREFLGLLMQWGHLSLEAKQFKSARAAWLECMELEGDEQVLTTAREDLMRMYLQLNRLDSAQRLGYERLLDDESTWIRYSTAWVMVQQQQQQQEDAMVRAIRSNPFCAYYLAFYDTFQSVMEYTEEMEEEDDVPQSSLEEALEYCTAEAAEEWKANGADVVLRNLLLGCLQGDASTTSLLTKEDLEWEDRLSKIEKEFESRQSDDSLMKEATQVSAKNDSDYQGNSDSSEHSGDEDEDEPLDLGMYIGMFRTAMEMLQESGELRKAPVTIPAQKEDPGPTEEMQN